MGCELAKTTANYHQQMSTGRNHQPIKSHPLKVEQIVWNEPLNEKHRRKNTDKNRMLPNPTESQTDTISATTRREKRTKPSINVRRSRNILKHRR